MKEFSVGQYDIAKFEKTEDFDIETKKKRKKMYLDLIEDYIKTDLLSMKEESENSAVTTQHPYRKLLVNKA